MTGAMIGREAQQRLTSARGRDLSTGQVGLFGLSVLGFSFWFFLAVPFASHREVYWWLATVASNDFGHAFSFISSTYRPLFQGAAWAGYMAVDTGTFPTSVTRQALSQLFVYSLFLLAWWLIFSGARERRTFALIAFVSGGVFFSGYVHLFHLYGIAYVPVLLVLGGLLRAFANGDLQRTEVAFAAFATVLVLWHPFATALFVGFFFGYLLETFPSRTVLERVRGLVILAIGTLAVALIVIVIPRVTAEASQLLVETATRPLGDRLTGLLVSYRTNEINRIASLVAFALTQAVAFSLPISDRLKLSVAAILASLGALGFAVGIPVVLLWVLVALAKLIWLRNWSLVFLLATALLLPFGGGIGTPMHGLFALITAAYATALGWSAAEARLAFLDGRVIGAMVLIALVLIVAIRAEVHVPVVTRLASPLLVERERTFQLESVLAWLSKSKYCGVDVRFAERADNPIDSVESAITRRNRPPAAIADVAVFWRTRLQCSARKSIGGRALEAVITFGGGEISGAKTVFEVPSKYAGPAAVWIPEPDIE